MPSTAILISLAILVISFMSGLLIYYLIEERHDENLKKAIEGVISLSINFVIYIWLGKILVNVKKFFSDPLAVLAYPSNSHAFYLATLFMLVNLLYRKYRLGEQVNLLLQAFIPIFLGTTFVYEFLQITVENSVFNKIYLYFIAVLLVIYTLIYGRLSRSLESFILSIILLLGQVCLTMFYKVTIFGYRLSPIYFLILMVIVIMTTIFAKKRKV